MHGDFGRSYYKDESTIVLFKETIPRYFQLIISTFILVMLVGIPVGFISVIYHGSLLDYITVVKEYTEKIL
jgi:ABC-type dipeptide/oligopeptide/nickel transport system permease component